MEDFEELFSLADQLQRIASAAEDESVERPTAAILEAAKEVGKSFSGSWQGYHARVYYAGFEPPPPGAHFSQEWGLMDTYASSFGSRGQWRECDAEQVKQLIVDRAGGPNLERAHEMADSAAETFERKKADIESILQSAMDARSDAFLDRLKEELEPLEPLAVGEVAQRLAPQGKIMTRDTVVLGQGTQVPPHMALIAEVRSINHSFAICRAAAEIARKAASHLERVRRRSAAVDRIGTNVFIGHGRSSSWRELKDFIQERLKLPWDEFNRVPVAGVTNIARLAEMLDAAAVALLVMTAEDERADGSMQARMNVIHEAGLFQGRLGFSRAVVLLEEGCEPFSNIDGLGQIRFPAGNISAAFEEVRRVLEREGLVDAL